MKPHGEITTSCLAWKKIFFILVCVCCKGIGGNVPGRSKTSATEIFLSWVWSLRVNLSHPASEISRVCTDLLPCIWIQNIVANSPRKGFAWLFWLNTVYSLGLLTLLRFAKVCKGSRTKDMLLKMCLLPSNHLGLWTFRWLRICFIQPASPPRWALINSFSFRVQPHSWISFKLHVSLRVI